MQKKSTTELLETFLSGGLFTVPENQKLSKDEALALGLIEIACAISLMAADAQFAREALGSCGVFPVSEIAGDYGYSAQAFNKLLCDQGIQYKRGRRWYLYNCYQGLGYTATRLTTREAGGRTRAFSGMQWTVKGRRFLYDHLRAQGIVPTAGRKEQP